MAAAAAANGGAQAAAREAANARRRPLLDSRLFMAARRGDSAKLKELLRLEDDGEERRVQQDGTPPTTIMSAAAAAAPAAQVFIVEMNCGSPRQQPHDAAGAPPPPAPVASGSAVVDKLDGVTIEGDSLLHVVAAGGDSEGFLRCARMIVRAAADPMAVLKAPNKEGDTPLHCAAGAGNAKMIDCLLVDLLATTTTAATTTTEVAALKKAFVRLRNERGETALHHAVKWASSSMRPSMRRSERAIEASCIGMLIGVDSELASIVTNDGTSPLYVAFSLAEMEIAHYLIRTAKKQAGNNNNLSYYSGPGGKNILHAAVSCGYVRGTWTQPPTGEYDAALPMVLHWLEEGEGPPEESGDEVTTRSDAAASARLLKQQLTSQGDDENGSTPLHLAASLRGFPATMWVPIWSWWSLGPSATRLLLLLEGGDDALVSTVAYQPDKLGLYPIHVAAGAGSLEAVKVLLHKCPECATLRDAKGRTFLHVAVDKGMFSVVSYVCRLSQLRRRRRRIPILRPPPAAEALRLAGLFSSVLNAQDESGDTPVHRAVHAGNLPVFRCLFLNPEVRLDVQNNKGMRPIDVSWSTMPLTAYYAWDPKLHIRNLLLRVVVPYGESRGDLFHDKLASRIVNPEFKGGEEKISENLTAAAQVMGIFSALVTTVTFASAFTLPGGYRSDGTPVLAETYAFDAFVLADVFAFASSFLATFLLLYAGVPAFNLDARFSSVNKAYFLMMNSGRSLVAALGLGLYVVLIPVARTVLIPVALLMALVAYDFLKAEGIDYVFSYPYFPTRREHTAKDVVAARIVSVLQHLVSYIIIFGFPPVLKLEFDTIYHWISEARI